MVSCALVTCSSRSTTDSKKTTGVTFHSFPRDPKRLKVWIHFVNRKNWTPGKSSVLCSKHFPKEHIDRTSLSSVRLRPFAVPMIKSIQNVGIPEQEQLSLLTVSDDVENMQVLASNQSQSTSRQKTETPLPEVCLMTSKSITVCKRKLEKRLNHITNISCFWKRKINALRQCVLRRQKKIASLQNVIEELKRSRLGGNASLRSVKLRRTK